MKVKELRKALRGIDGKKEVKIVSTLTSPKDSTTQVEVETLFIDGIIVLMQPTIFFPEEER